MCRMLCYNSPIDVSSLIYYKTNGIITLIKHVDVNHVVIAKNVWRGSNSLARGVLERQILKENLMCLVVQYHNFLVKKILSKMMCNKNNSCKTLAFWLSKITYLFNLWIAHGWTLLPHIYVQELCFLKKSSFHKMCCPIWWRG
jgi:hypothetical protein